MSTLRRCGGAVRGGRAARRGEARWPVRDGPRGEGDVGARAGGEAARAPPLRVRRAGGAVRALRLQAAAQLRRLRAGAVGRAGGRAGGGRRRPGLAEGAAGMHHSIDD